MNQLNDAPGLKTPGVGALEERFIHAQDGSSVRAILHPSSSASPRRLLLIHGNPRSLDDWDQLVPLLSSAFEVLSIDLPGFGQSTRPAAQQPSDLALPRLAQVVLDVADSLGWTQPFTVVGHSHGGGVAQLLAAQHPRRVRSIVLLGTLAFPVHLNYRLLPLPGVRQLMKLGRALLRTSGFVWVKRALVRQVLRMVSAPQRPSEAEVAQELESMTRAPHSLLSMVDVSLGGPSVLLRQVAPRIQCPTLIIHGQQDAVVPVRCAQALYAETAAARANVRLEILPDAGHMLARYQAQRCAELIIDFERGVPGAAAAD